MVAVSEENALSSISVQRRRVEWVSGEGFGVRREWQEQIGSAARRLAREAGHVLPAARLVEHGFGVVGIVF
jgi:hypothetical protein